MLIANSGAMHQAFAAARAASIRAPRTVLLIGGSGVGKGTLARALAADLRLPFDELLCQGEDPRIRKWLFHIQPLEEGSLPGLAGRPGPRVLYLGRLESTPGTLLPDLVELVMRRRYLDAEGRLRAADNEVVLVGGITASSHAPRELEPLVRAFGHEVRVPVLAERQADVTPLAELLFRERDGRYLLTADGAQTLRDCDFSESNGHQLRDLINRIVEPVLGVVGVREITRQAIETAVLSAVVFAAAGFEVHGAPIGADHLGHWVQQFPADLRPTAAHLVQRCRSHYYCSGALWWSRLRRLFEQLVDDVAGNEPRPIETVQRRMVLSTLQAPGKGEGRALADFAKAAGLPQSVQRLQLWRLVKALRKNVSWVHRSVLLVFVDDWMGSGRQMRENFDTAAPLLREIAQACANSGRSLAIRLLCVGCHIGAHEELARAAIWEELDIRALVAWELTSEDQCFSAGSRILGDPVRRAAMREFALETGKRLLREHPLGWPPGELLVVFAHSVPNNTLPLLWCEEGEGGWRALRPGLRA